MTFTQTAHRKISTTSNDTQHMKRFPSAGPLAIPMTNDYLFRALLQRNNKVLKSLICSLLHLASDNVVSVEIMNPIELGASINDNTFILDIKITLNNQVYQLSQEKRIRMECEAREDYYRTQRGIQCMLEEKNAAIETLTAEINKLHRWMKARGYDPDNIE